MGNIAVYKVATTGRTSGRACTAMLMAPVRDGDTFVFVAYTGGKTANPDWYRADTSTYHTRTATGVATRWLSEARLR